MTPTEFAALRRPEPPRVTVAQLRAACVDADLLVTALGEVDAKGAAYLTRLSVGRLANLRWENGGAGSPAWSNPGGGRIWYSLAALADWLNHRSDTRV